jgi:glycosyltransferase involved in cell wall biosynthesis
MGIILSDVRILVDYRPALRARTGVGEYVHELARALVATAPDGESLRLFSSSWRDRLDPRVLPGAAVVDRRWPVRALNYLWHRWGWPPAEQLAGAPLDVVQSLHPLLMPARHAAQVVTIHDLDFLDHPERTSAEVRRDYPALAAAHAARADRVITISRFTATEITRRLGVPVDRITVASPGAPAWAPRAEEPPDPYLLFLGTLEPRKNLGVLLDAYAGLLEDRSRRWPRLVIAGRAAPGSEAWVARATRAPLASHVELRGYVAPDARQALMSGAMALVMPSLMEGFGLPVLEAMSLGVPVIASQRGSLPEVMGDAGMLADATDALAWRTAIARLVASPEERRAMAARGLARAAHYQWRDAARHTREAWALAVDARARRG